MDENTSKLRSELARNEKLATEISQALARFKLSVPKGMTIVWEPTVVLDPETIYDAYHHLINGIPEPDILVAGMKFKQQFAIKQHITK